VRVTPLCDMPAIALIEMEILGELCGSGSSTLNRGVVGLQRK
jgi:hypothetical protein